MFHLAVLLITHHRTEDVKISMKLIREVWSQEKDLQDVDIYHAYNGEFRKYPKKSLENKLIRRPNPGHYAGAADLINSGIKEILRSKKNYDYVFVMSGDVWLIKPKILVNVLKTMTSKKYQFATSLWPDLFFILRYFASEFFIITPKLAKKVFPLHLNKPFLTLPLVEQALTHQVLYNTHRQSVYLLLGRRFNYGLNRFYSPLLGYLSHHNLPQKLSLASNLSPSLDSILSQKPASISRRVF